MSTKVLIVDDVELNRELTARLLAIHGYNIVFANDGNQAITVSQAELPDVILMDIALPDIDGWQVTKILKSSLETKHIPVIALTAHDALDYRIKTEEAGCAGFVTKPIEMNVLLKEIQKSLSK